MDDAESLKEIVPIFICFTWFAGQMINIICKSSS